MVAGAIVARSFGDAGHGNWVLLTIAVIMRASYGWTRKRRDDRIVGTLIGCVIARSPSPTLPIGALVLAAQALALALTHGFVRSNYRLASIGASMMALVSLHLVNPGETGSAIDPARRHADRRRDRASLQPYPAASGNSSRRRRLVARLLSQIGAFADVALRRDALDAGLPPRAQGSDRGDRRAVEFRRRAWAASRARPDAGSTKWPPC